MIILEFLDVPARQADARAVGRGLARLRLRRAFVRLRAGGIVRRRAEVIKRLVARCCDDGDLAVAECNKCDAGHACLSFCSRSWRRARLAVGAMPLSQRRAQQGRSEEHTSELQSRL